MYVCIQYVVYTTMRLWTGIPRLRIDGLDSEGSEDGMLLKWRFEEMRKRCVLLIKKSFLGATKKIKKNSPVLLWISSVSGTRRCTRV